MNDPQTIIDAYLDDELTDSQRRELVQWIAKAPANRKQFVAACYLHSHLTDIFWGQRMAGSTDALPVPDVQQTAVQPVSNGEPSLAEPFSPSARFPAFVSNAWNGTIGFFSQEVPFACLVATAFMGIALAICSQLYVTHYDQYARTFGTLDVTSPRPTPLASRPSPVARITGMVDVKWGNEGLGIRDWGLEKGSGVRRQGSETDNPENPKSRVPSPESRISNPESHAPRLSPHAPVSVGDRLAIASGLVQLTYNSGAQVILQGPCTYEVSSPTSGFLSLGKLTAKVEGAGVGGRKSGEVSSDQWPVASEKPQTSDIHHSSFSIHRSPPPSPLFTIRTPTAVITDLGTEFGIEVNERGDTLSHVFRGSVSLQLASTDGRLLGTARVLNENETALVEIDGGGQGAGNGVIVVGPAAQPISFIRELSKGNNHLSDRFDVVAFWQFDGDNFLTDSSGHGHTLINNGAKQVDNAAFFNGSAVMQTVDSIDLTPYTKVRISWLSRAVDCMPNQVLWEHSSNYNNLPGAIIAYLDKGEGYAGIRNASADMDNRYRLDAYPVAVETLERFTVEFDRTSPKRSGIVKVFKNGMLIGRVAPSFTFGYAPDSFASAPFYIGAREGAEHPFVGLIDDLKIEGQIDENIGAK